MSIRTEDTAKPDPDEPWRYACPDCGSPALFQQGELNSGEERYECSHCFSWLALEDLVDRKHTEPVDGSV